MAGALFTSLWKPGSGARYTWYGAQWSAFQSKLQQLSQSGYELQSATVSLGSQAPEWTGVWRSGGRQEQSAGEMSWDQLIQADNNFRSRNAYPRVIRSSSGATTTWSGIWSSGPASWISPPAAWTDFWTTWLSQHANGRHLSDIDTCLLQGKRYWTGLWEQRAGDQFIWSGVTWDDFLDKHRDLTASNYGLDIVQSYDDVGVRKWVGVWGENSPVGALVADQTEEQFWAEWQRQVGLGRRLSYLQCWRGAGFATVGRLSHRLRLHIRTVSVPDLPVQEMIDRMREVYEKAGIEIEVASVQSLDLGGQLDVDVGPCSATSLTAEQSSVFSHRDGITSSDIAIYFVRTTIPPYNGCAAHPAASPGVILSSYASPWTLAHEVGHVLGLDHVYDIRRLMTSQGTANIVDPPPDLADNEIEIMTGSTVVIAVA